MTSHRFIPGVTRRAVLTLAALLPVLGSPVLTGLSPGGPAHAQTATADPLGSWNDGPAKQAIIDFVRATTDPANPNFVGPEDRIATFDLDGTLWVSHPMYTQVVYAFDRVPAVVKAKPELATVEPFKTVLSGDQAAIAKLSTKDLETIVSVAFSGMSVETFRAEANKWLETAQHPRWKRPYTALAYQPMQEVINYLRAKGFRTYIVTGTIQDFVRVFAERVYGIPPEQVIGSADTLKFGYDAQGKPLLTIEPKLLLNDDFSGKPDDIHMFIGRRPFAAFGNSTEDGPPDARIHQSGARDPAGDDRIARRRQARICLWSRRGPARHQGRLFPAGAIRRSEKAGLGRHQHEERLEANLCI